MKLVLAVLLNAALLAVLLPWARRQWAWASPRWWRVAFLLGLGLRVGVGVARSWNPLKNDAEFMSDLAGLVTARLWTDPAGTTRMLFQSEVVLPIRDHAGLHLYNAVYQSTSNTWFLAKALALLNLGSLGAPMLNSIYLSVFAFVGCWQLARKLVEALPETPAGAGAVAFLLWPSVWFWATGISKEAVLLGSGAWLTAHVVGRLYGPKFLTVPGAWPRAKWWLGAAALALLHFQMRYFLALPLLGVLGGVVLGHWLAQFEWGRQRWAQVAVLGAVLLVGAWVGPQVSVAFRVNKFTHQVIRVYSHEVAQSVGKPHIEYPDLRPTMESILAHAPLAAANAITRPWPGESWQPLYAAAGLENAAMLTLLVLAAVAVARGRPGRLPFALGLGLTVFCLILAVLIGLTTANLGSLNRYRSELVPFLLLLLLQNEYAAALLRWVGLDGSPKAHTRLPGSLARPVA